MGAQGREHVLNNYGFDNFNKKWDEILSSVHDRCGSWAERKNHKNWEVREL